MQRAKEPIWDQASWEISMVLSQSADDSDVICWIWVS
jgi:hypothetical protein